MENWKKLIGQCFGLEDRPFAEHPSDEATAFELLDELRRRHVGWSELERELRRQLGQMPKLNTDHEVVRVYGYFRVWLLD